VRCGAAAFLIWMAASDASAQTDAAATSRVRSGNATLASFIADARHRSPTFSRIVDEINDTDGLVYVEQGRCRHVRACLLLSVSVAGPYRVLRVLVDVRKTDADLMGSIGHELQHALEVLSDRQITSDAAILFFYQRHGKRVKNIFETEAAIAAGDAVRDEITRSQRESR
jgi:hypothetical protein